MDWFPKGSILKRIDSHCIDSYVSIASVCFAKHCDVMSNIVIAYAVSNAAIAYATWIRLTTIHVTHLPQKGVLSHFMGPIRAPTDKDVKDSHYVLHLIPAYYNWPY